MSSLDRSHIESVFNEGKLIAIVPSADADTVLEVMYKHEYGKHTTIIGNVVDQYRGMFVAKTCIGGTRVIGIQIGEQLSCVC